MVKTTLTEIYDVQHLIFEQLSIFDLLTLSKVSRDLRLEASDEISQRLTRYYATFASDPSALRTHMRETGAIVIGCSVAQWMTGGVRPVSWFGNQCEMIMPYPSFEHMEVYLISEEGYTVSKRAKVYSGPHSHRQQDAINDLVSETATLTRASDGQEILLVCTRSDRSEAILPLQWCTGMMNAITPDGFASLYPRFTEVGQSFVTPIGRPLYNPWGLLQCLASKMEDLQRVGYNFILSRDRLSAQDHDLTGVMVERTWRDRDMLWYDESRSVRKMDEYLLRWWLGGRLGCVDYAPTVVVEDHDTGQAYPLYTEDGNPSHIVD